MPGRKPPPSPDPKAGLSQAEFANAQEFDRTQISGHRTRRARSDDCHCQRQATALSVDVADPLADPRKTTG